MAASPCYFGDVNVKARMMWRCATRKVRMGSRSPVRVDEERPAPGALHLDIHNLDAVVRAPARGVYSAWVRPSPRIRKAGFGPPVMNRTSIAGGHRTRIVVPFTSKS